jgi:putative transposase
MIVPRPTRLRSFDYRGLHGYHVRVATWDRVPIFGDAALVLLVSDRLLHHASVQEFDVISYCFMYDHVHALFTGRSHCSDLRAYMKAWKQETAYLFARMTRRRLWQPGYFDRVLRDAESTRSVARYIMENPLRAGLATRVGEYPHAWCVWGTDLWSE